MVVCRAPAGWRRAHPAQPRWRRMIVDPEARRPRRRWNPGRRAIVEFLGRARDRAPERSAIRRIPSAFLRPLPGPSGDGREAAHGRRRIQGNSYKRHAGVPARGPHSGDQPQLLVGKDLVETILDASQRPLRRQPSDSARTAGTDGLWGSRSGPRRGGNRSTNPAGCRRGAGPARDPAGAEETRPTHGAGSSFSGGDGSAWGASPSPGGGSRIDPSAPPGSGMQTSARVSPEGSRIEEWDGSSPVRVWNRTAPGQPGSRGNGPRAPVRLRSCSWAS